MGTYLRVVSCAKFCPLQVESRDRNPRCLKSITVCADDGSRDGDVVMVKGREGQWEMGNGEGGWKGQRVWRFAFMVIHHDCWAAATVLRLPKAQSLSDGFQRFYDDVYAV